MWFARRVKVIANPSAGRGRAAVSLDLLRNLLGPDDSLEITRAPGHAMELAHEATLAGWPVVAAAGGDGTVHEVACGLLDAGTGGSTLAVLPVGSANDYAWGLDLRPHWWKRPGMVPQPVAVDVGRLEWGPGAGAWFVNGVGAGFNGMVTLESRRIRHLRGLPLYAMAVWRALGKRTPEEPWRVVVDGVALPEARRLTVSLALGPREGNFVVAPGASLVDGLFEILAAEPLSTVEILGLLPRLAVGGKLSHPRIWQERGSVVELELPASTYFIAHADGELVVLPEQRKSRLVARVLPRHLRVLAGPALNG